MFLHDSEGFPGGEQVAEDPKCSCPYLFDGTEEGQACTGSGSGQERGGIVGGVRKEEGAVKKNL